MFTIQLQHLNFFGFHGIHEEEKILGNEFEVHVSVLLEEEQVSSIEHTVNYVDIYKIIKNRMEIPAALLESLAQDLVHSIQQTDKRIRSVSVSIEKKHPPIPNMTGSVSVRYKKDF